MMQADGMDSGSVSMQQSTTVQQQAELVPVKLSRSNAPIVLTSSGA